MPVSASGLFHEIEGDGPWVIFAHGGDGNHLCWHRQVAALKHRYRCLSYDAPGFGLTPPDATGNLLSLMDELTIERAVLIGHSMGGLAVSGVTQNHPNRVRALVMSDTPFGFFKPALSRWAGEMLEKIPKGFAVLDHLFAPNFAARDPRPIISIRRSAGCGCRPRFPRNQQIPLPAISRCATPRRWTIPAFRCRRCSSSETAMS